VEVLVKQRILPLVYSESQMIELVRAPRRDTATGVRDRAILAVLAACGLRASELCNLRVADLQGAVIFVRQGKYGDQRFVPISSRARAAVDRYLAQSRAEGEIPVFRCLDGRPINRRHLLKIVTRYTRALGFAGSVHSWRHSFAVRCLNKGMSLQTVKLLLGHRSITSTSHYLNLSLDAVVAEYRRCLELPVERAA
jgi:integrase/recombinase XerD